MRKLLVYIVMTTAISSAHADDALDDRACLELGRRGSPNYQECRSLLILLRSGDPYLSARGRAGLLGLMQLRDAEGRRPPPPAVIPAYPPGASPALECQTWGDGIGGGITRCY